MGAVHEALRQVRELQERILEKQRFKGYSGRARAISGTLALVAAAIMASRYFPSTLIAHLTGWGVVFVLSLILNYGALLYWFLRDPRAKRDMRRLKPVKDNLPPLIVGGVLTLALVLQNLHSWLFPVWMCLFGLSNLATRPVLPRGIVVIGWFYIVAGTLLLLMGPYSFLNPWPMGMIFFAGEWMGGIVLHFDESSSFSNFFYPNQKSYEES
jgi:hypothetical protein